MLTTHNNFTDSDFKRIYQLYTRFLGGELYYINIYYIRIYSSLAHKLYFNSFYLNTFLYNMKHEYNT